MGRVSSDQRDGPAASTTSTASTEVESERLREIERARLAAAVAGDREVLERLHAPSFLLCTPSGDVWNRARYLEGLVDGSIDYVRFEPVTAIEVELDSALAVLRYRSEIEISIDGGAAGHLICWHLDVYRRHGAVWRCLWSQATDTLPA